MLSSNLEITLRNAYQLATENKHEFVTLEHLLNSLTNDKDAISVLKACGVEIEELNIFISESSLAKKIKKILNSKKKLISSNLQKYNSPEKRRPNMKRSLNYSRINHNFEKGLKDTVLWYKEHYRK